MSTGKKKIFVYFMMSLSLIISVKLIKDIVKLKLADKRMAEAEQELITAKKEQEELKRKLGGMSESNWWEKQVRNVLNMAKPREVVVVVPEEVKRTNDTEPTAILKQEEPNNLIKWLQVFSK